MKDGTEGTLKNNFSKELENYFSFNKFLDYDSDYDSSREDDMSVQSDYSDIESVGNALSYGDRLPEEDADYDHLMVEYVVPTPKLTHPSAKQQRVLGTKTLAPVMILVASTTGCCKSQHILKVLCDSGSGKILIHQRVIPKKAKTVAISTKSLTPSQVNYPPMRCCI